MKKIIYILLVVIICVVLLIVGIMRNLNSNQEILEINVESNEFMPYVLNNLYETDYEYTKEVLVSMPTYEIKTIYEGQVLAKPYKEHIEVIEYPQDIITNEGMFIYSEIYYYEEGNNISAIIVTDDEIVEQKGLKRNYPYGYREDITFSRLEDTSINGVELYSFQGEYLIDVGEAYRLEELVAVINQTYYVNQDNFELIRYETDLTDYNKKLAMAMDVSLNGSTIKEAEENYKDYSESYLEIVNIYNIGNVETFKLPE